MKTYKSKLAYISICVILFTSNLHSQNDREAHIATAVPSLSIAPDARAGGMGDAGVASFSDNYSQYWNPAKYAFSSRQHGAGMSYTPWLRKVVNDMYMLHASGFYKLGNDDNQALSASLRYFTLGDVDVADLHGNFMEQASSYEMAFDVAYSRKLSNTFSLAVALRYIRADYNNFEDGKVGNAFAADIAGYNESYINLFNAESMLSLGFNISNIGTKIETGGIYKSFLPTTLRFGVGLLQPLNELNTLSLNVDFNKVLVPAMPVRTFGEDDQSFNQRLEKYNDRSALSSMIRSFSDKSFSTELKEIGMSLGAEYIYDAMFMLRTGYHYESKYAGNRKYVTFGAGFRWQMLQIDASYLMATKGTNPLDQTFRLSFGYSM